MNTVVAEQSRDFMEDLRMNWIEAKRELDNFFILWRYIHRKTKIQKNVHGQVN